MGRTISVYGIQYKLLATKMDFKEAGIDLLDLYLNHTQEFVGKSIRRKLKSNPENLSADVVEFLICAFNDFEELANLDISYTARLNQMSQNGVARLFEISATNPSNVFMNSFHRFIEMGMGEIQDQSEYNYLINEQTSSKLFEFLALVAKYFREMEQESDIEIHISPKIIEPYTELIQKIYFEEAKLRAGDKASYESKWGADYFNFAFNFEQLLTIHAQIKQYDRILIADSY